jgi:hypothetical protein
LAYKLLLLFFLKEKKKNRYFGLKHFIVFFHVVSAAPPIPTHMPNRSIKAAPPTSPNLSRLPLSHTIQKHPGRRLPDRMRSFTNFCETWFVQLNHLVNQLYSAPRPPSTPDQHHHLLQLVHKVMSQYAEYYRVKGLAAERDPLSILAAPWATSLECSLHWIAGWRPTTAFHLVYTESSIRFESHIAEILRGMSTGDLGDLSPSQFRRVSELQCETVMFLWKMLLCTLHMFFCTRLYFTSPVDLY